MAVGSCQNQRMNIHQLSVNYVQEQDRILVRINTTNGDELRLWFTRRLTLSLWPLLNKIVADFTAREESKKAPVVAQDDDAKRMLADFKKEENIQKADFKTPFREQPAALPLGVEPLLVTEINVSPLPSGQLQLAFAEKLPGVQNPRGFQMALEQQLVHGFLHLIDKAIGTSQWNVVQGAVASAPAEEPALAAAEKPRYLN